MKAIIEPGMARGKISAPPSKSCAHRLLICAALAAGETRIDGAAMSQDILATMDCVQALGAEIREENGSLLVKGCGGQLGAKDSLPVLSCRESGSTLRFMVPLALCNGGGTFRGAERLMARGVSVYEELLESRGVTFVHEKDSLTVKGRLQPGVYRMRGDVSSQFISGLLFALPLLEENSVIEILPPFESKGYVDMTLEALETFGIRIVREEAARFIVPGGQGYRPARIAVEGDWSQAAFFYGLNALGGQIEVTGLRADSLQGDKVCKSLMQNMTRGFLQADLSDCPDLAPALFAVAAGLEHGACFTGTRRLAIKESSRAAVMAAELAKFGAEISVGENTVQIAPTALHRPEEVLLGHNDHRVVMALAVLATKWGGVIDDAQAVAKSYPDFFRDMAALGVKLRLEERGGMEA